MSEWIKKLSDANELSILDKEVDVNLEAAYISYLEMKKDNPKAILFTNVINKKLGLRYDIPVLMNVFGSTKKCEMIFGGKFDDIAAKIDGFLKLKKPKTLKEKIQKLKDIFELRHVFPKSVSNGECQEVVYPKGKG